MRTDQQWRAIGGVAQFDELDQVAAGFIEFSISKASELQPDSQIGVVEETGQQLVIEGGPLQFCD
jgi:hypothetical protein